MRFFLPLLLLAITSQAQQPLATNKLISRIGFGSCNSQDTPQLIWETISKNKPELFILLGDNIYGDTKDMKELKAKYDQFGSNLPTESLRKTAP